MNASTLIEHLAGRGVRLSVEADRLVAVAPRNTLTAADRDALMRFKAEVLALLASPPVVEQTAADRFHPELPGPTDRTRVNPDHDRLGPAVVTAPSSNDPADASWQAELAGWPDDFREEWNERAAFMECDGGLTRPEAERRAFLDVACFAADWLPSRRVPTPPAISGYARGGHRQNRQKPLRGKPAPAHLAQPANTVDDCVRPSLLCRLSELSEFPRGADNSDTTFDLPRAVMTTTTVQCDKCGAIIEAGRTMLTAETGPFRVSWQRNPISGGPTLDLCPGCAQALAGWLAQTGLPVVSAGSRGPESSTPT